MRGESEIVEELLDRLVESERRGDNETFKELLMKLEESEERELMVWHSMHGIRLEERGPEDLCQFIVLILKHVLKFRNN